MVANAPARLRLGRYVLFDEIASGGMASVHYARMLGPVGFTRTVAIKRLHRHRATDPEFVAMFLDEARLAARIQHPNVVPIVDVVALEDELFLVMEYVHGEALSAILRLLRLRNERMPVSIAVRIMTGTLYGLHAAHEAKTEHGESLAIVHRDVSPQNVLVGVDGVARVFDFGIAKAEWRAQTTREGQVKGKLSYMSPEQLRRSSVDRRSDIYSASVVFWEMLTGQRLFAGDDPGGIVTAILTGSVVPPSYVVRDVPPELDALVLRGLSTDATARYATAEDMVRDLERILPPATRSDTATWLKYVAGAPLDRRAERLAAIERLPVDAADEGAPVSSGVVARADAVPSSEAPTDLDAPRPPQVFDATLTVPMPVPSRRARMRFAAIAAAVTVFAATVGGVAYVRSAARRGAPAPPEVASSTASVPRNEAPAAAPTELPAAIATEPPSGASAPASAAPSAPHGSGAIPAPPRTPSRPKAAPPQPTATATTNPDCDPPFVYDGHVKVFKKQCLR